MEPVYPLIIKGTVEVNKKKTEDKSYDIPVKISYGLPHIPQSPDTLTSFEMRFPFNYISDKFEVFLKNWFEKAELLEPVYALYFGTLYNPRMYLEHQFLSLTQALESFHRRVYGGKYLSDPNYEKMKEYLKNGLENVIEKSEVKGDFKNCRDSKIKFGNEFSLRQRLRELFDKY